VFRKLMRKKRVVVGLSIAVLVVAGAAIAYWTASGEGEGTGKVASNNGSLVLSGTITDELTPGGSSPVTFTASNSSKSSLQVGSVHAVVSTDKPGCEVEDFTIADTEENQTIPGESSDVALTTDGSISMANTEANQDACKGATISLELSS
jgi:hypothetical protein